MKVNLKIQSLRKVIKYVFFAGILFSVVATACSHDKKKSKTKSFEVYENQPKIDSPFVISYIKSNPKFKGQLYWAKEFYKEREFNLGWFKDNELVPQAYKLLEVINKANEDALDSMDYKVVDIPALISKLKASKSDTAAYHQTEKELDLALSNTYFIWANDYYRGRIIPKKNANIEWDVKRNKIKLHKALATVLNFRESKYEYADFKPMHKDYSNLKTALANYRKIKANGGWPKVPAGTYKLGDSSANVSVLRKRLLGDSGTKYDQTLDDAVKKFQVSQGLNPDGKLGKGTLALLNIPVESRIETIILNMERWRWIPKSFEPDYLLVNIPEYKLHVYEKGEEKFNMRVIVGKTLNSTPIFSDKMEYVVLSPYWNVPFSIVKKELAPKLSGNPNYLEHLDMEVVDYKGNPISTSSINWSSVSEDNFKYVIRRRPGPKNDLGDVKFIFPNENNVYLHDTPHDELFSQEKRGFSHGCVRLEKPIDLAVYLLRKIPNYDRNRIEDIISERQEKTVNLKEKLPVYLLYMTAWADTEGNVNFRDDIYGHDKALAKEYYKQ
jgi:murein L,D-transpeptidase YcbB/YkuD